MKTYKITKPHCAIDSRYDGEQVLCYHTEDNQRMMFVPWFNVGAFWQEVEYSSIDDCRTRLAAFHDLKPGALFILNAEKKGYDVWTVDLEPRTTVDGSEIYHNGLTWLATIEEV